MKRRRKGLKKLLSAVLASAMICGMFAGQNVEAAKAGVAGDSVVLDKWVSEGTAENEYMLTLEAYVTGQVQDMKRPADVVLVLDQSASMYTPIGASGNSGKNWQKSTSVYVPGEDKVKTYTWDQVAADKEHAAFRGYYIAQNTEKVDGSYFWYIVEYNASNSEKPWRLYQVYNTSKPSEDGDDDWGGDVKNPVYVDMKEADLKALEGYNIYQTQYGALYDAIDSFSDTLIKAGEEDGVNHRLAVAGFSSNNIEDTAFSKGSGVYLGSSFDFYSEDENGNVEDSVDFANAFGYVTTDKEKVQNAIKAVRADYQSTHHEIGLRLAKEIFKANPVEEAADYDERIGRDRMVVFFTDGAPSPTKVNSAVDNAGEVKDQAVAEAKAIKDMGASVYTICTAVAQDVFLDYVSSEYPDATSTSSTGSKAEGVNFTDSITNADEMLASFQKIVNEVGGADIALDETAVLKDIVSDDFKLPEGIQESDIKVYTAARNADGSFAEKVPFADANIVIADNDVRVSNFDYSENYVSENPRTVDGAAFYGKKIIVEVPIETADDNYGGIHQQTNNTDEKTSGIYTANDLLVKEFPIPHVDIPTDITVKKVVTGLNADDKVDFNFEVGYTKVLKSEAILDYTNVDERNQENFRNYLEAVTADTTAKFVLNGSDNSEKTIGYVLPGSQMTITETNLSDEYVMEKVVIGETVYPAANNQVVIPAIKVGDEVVVYNKHIKQDLSGEKTWDDADNQDGKRPESIEVQLLANGNPVEGQKVTVTAETNWKYTFENVDIYDNDGKEITYTVSEKAVEGYTPSYDGMNINNAHDPEKISVSGTKTWSDAGNQDGKRPESIEVNLFANGQEVDSQTVTAETQWTYTFDNLDKYSNGEEIVYTVTEDPVGNGYSASIEGFDITNTYAPEKTSVNGVKTWRDDDNRDGVRPERITINLLKDGKEVDEKVVTADDNWAWTFENLDKYRDGGKEIVYTITEDAVEKYTTSVDGYNVTNTYAPEKTFVSGIKTWDDNENQDGLRPDSIIINLYADGEFYDSQTVTAETQWAYTFDDLYVYRHNGVEIEYTIEEEAVEGYETTYEGNDVINKHEIILTEVSGSKIWNDDDNRDGLRPDSITINLFADGEKVNDTVVTAEDDWAWTFENLPKYRDGGVEIEYTITEDEVEGYETVIEDGIVTNTHEIELQDIAGVKTWDDKDDKDGIRPESITINLLADGEVIGSKEVTEADDWAWVFEELPVYRDGGKEIEYTITEDPVEGYKTIIDGYNVTNEHTPKIINIVKTGDTAGIGMLLAMVFVAFAAVKVSLNMKRAAKRRR